MRVLVYTLCIDIDQTYIILYNIYQSMIVRVWLDFAGQGPRSQGHTYKCLCIVFRLDRAWYFVFHKHFSCSEYICN